MSRSLQLRLLVRNLISLGFDLKKELPRRSDSGDARDALEDYIEHHAGSLPTTIADWIYATETLSAEDIADLYGAD